MSLLIRFSLSVPLLCTITQAQLPTLVPQQGSTALGGPPLGGTTHQLAGAPSAVQLSPPNFDKLRIQPGFLLHMTVLNEPQLTQDLRVDEAGNVTVSLLGTVHLQGMSESDAQSAITEAYQHGDILRAPQVALTISQYVSPRVSVLGQVQSPGEYELIAPTDLLTVISMAGGPSPDAGSRIVLRHAKEKTEEVVRFERNSDNSNLQHFTVRAGDSVVVKRAGVVYVLGAVNRPGGYVMQPDGEMSVLQAIAFALDTSVYASTEDIHIVRKTEEGLITIPVKYKSLVKGKASAQALEPEDIIYVPTSKMKFALANTKQLASQASGAAIYGSIAH